MLDALKNQIHDIPLEALHDALDCSTLPQEASEQIALCTSPDALIDEYIRQRNAFSASQAI